MIRILILFLLATVVVKSAYAEERSVAASAKDTVPLKAGDTMPDVSVNDVEGMAVKLRSIHADHPVVIVFFRGSWCPICTRHFQELIKVHPETVRLGATMVAISPDTEENTRDHTAELMTPFPLYSDSDLVATKAFGLAFKVDDSTITKYKGFGIDLEKASGRDHHALPVPAVYLVDKSGRIVFAHSNPDYTKRLDTDTILTELKKAR